MKKFNSFFKSKLTKFVIILVVIGLFCFSFYKKNKQEVKEAVLLYTKGDKSDTTTGELTTNDNELDEEKEVVDKDKINNYLVKKRKPKKWVDTKADEYKQIVERIKQQDKNKILEKYSFTKEDIKKAESLVNEKSRATIEFQQLLKNEYNNKKSSGKLKYGKKINDNDYIYVAVDSVSINKKIQNTLDKKTTFFVIKIDSKSEKTFNKKLFGKKINDVVYLKIEDFLDKEKAKLLHETRADAQEAIENFVKAYPHLDIPEYTNSIKNMDFSMKFTVLDILDENFIEKNDIKNKVFNYNKGI